MTLDRKDDIRRTDEIDGHADTELTVGERLGSVQASATRGEDPDVAALRADIEETRLEMGDTINELGGRLEPGHLVDQAKQNVRDATIGRVEETARGMSDMVMETIKRNPIPAAMAGAGLALLWMNRSNGNANGMGAGSQRHRSESWTSNERGTDGQQGRDIGDRIGEGASLVSERVGEAGDNVRHAIGGAGENVGQTVGQVGQQIDRFMQASPLAMGAIALGAGAVVGALVPETQLERDTLGDASRQIGETVRQGVDQAAGEAERSLDEAERSMTASGSRTSS